MSTIHEWRMMGRIQIFRLAVAIGQCAWFLSLVRKVELHYINHDCGLFHVHVVVGFGYLEYILKWWLAM